MLDLSLWFLFPIAILTSTIAMMSGIGGAVFFSPLLIVALKLEPHLALASGLFIEFFGFSSGLIGYLRAKVINFSFVKRLLIYTIPGTILGVSLGRFIPGLILELLLCALLLALSYSFLFKKKKLHIKHPHHTGEEKHHHLGRADQFTRLSSFLGGSLLGLISAGLGEINEYNFLKRLEMKPSAAAGNSVFLIACSASVGILLHSYFIATQSGFQILEEILSIIIFAIPGVIIGAQIGVHLSKKVHTQFMMKFVGVLFAVISGILLLTM